MGTYSPTLFQLCLCLIMVTCPGHPLPLHREEELLANSVVSTEQTKSFETVHKWSGRNSETNNRTFSGEETLPAQDLMAGDAENAGNAGDPGGVGTSSTGPISGKGKDSAAINKDLSHSEDSIQPFSIDDVQSSAKLQKTTNDSNLDLLFRDFVQILGKPVLVTAFGGPERSKVNDLPPFSVDPEGQTHFDEFDPQERGFGVWGLGSDPGGVEMSEEDRSREKRQVEDLFFVSNPSDVVVVEDLDLVTSTSTEPEVISQTFSAPTNFGSGDIGFTGEQFFHRARRSMNEVTETSGSTASPRSDQADVASTTVALHQASATEDSSSGSIFRPSSDHSADHPGTLIWKSTEGPYGPSSSGPMSTFIRGSHLDTSSPMDPSTSTSMVDTVGSSTAPTMVDIVEPLVLPNPFIMLPVSSDGKYPVLVEMSNSTSSVNGSESDGASARKRSQRSTFLLPNRTSPEETTSSSSGCGGGGQNAPENLTANQTPRSDVTAINTAMAATPVINTATPPTIPTTPATNTATPATIATSAVSNAATPATTTSGSTAIPTYSAVSNGTVPGNSSAEIESSPAPEGIMVTEPTMTNFSTSGPVPSVVQNLTLSGSNQSATPTGTLPQVTTPPTVATNTIGSETSSTPASPGNSNSSAIPATTEFPGVGRALILENENATAAESCTCARARTGESTFVPENLETHQNLTTTGNTSAVVSTTLPPPTTLPPMGNTTQPLAASTTLPPMANIAQPLPASTTLPPNTYLAKTYLPPGAITVSPQAITAPIVGNASTAPISSENVTVNGNGTTPSPANCELTANSTATGISSGNSAANGVPNGRSDLIGISEPTEAPPTTENLTADNSTASNAPNSTATVVTSEGENFTVPASATTENSTAFPASNFTTLQLMISTTENSVGPEAISSAPNSTSLPSIPNSNTPPSTLNSTAPLPIPNSTVAPSTENFTAPPSTGNSTAPPSTGNSTAPPSTPNSTAPPSVSPTSTNATASILASNATAPPSTGNFTAPPSTENATTPPLVLTTESPIAPEAISATASPTAPPSTGNSTAPQSTANSTVPPSTSSPTAPPSTSNSTSPLSTGNSAAAPSLAYSTTPPMISTTENSVAPEGISATLAPPVPPSISVTSNSSATINSTGVTLITKNSEIALHLTPPPVNPLPCQSYTYGSPENIGTKSNPTVEKPAFNVPAAPLTTYSTTTSSNNSSSNSATVSTTSGSSTSNSHETTNSNTSTTISSTPGNGNSPFTTTTMSTTTSSTNNSAANNATSSATNSSTNASTNSNGNSSTTISSTGPANDLARANLAPIGYPAPFELSSTGAADPAPAFSSYPVFDSASASTPNTNSPNSAPNSNSNPTITNSMPNPNSAYPAPQPNSSPNTNSSPTSNFPNFGPNSNSSNTQSDAPPQIPDASQSQAIGSVPAPAPNPNSASSSSPVPSSMNSANVPISPSSQNSANLQNPSSSNSGTSSSPLTSSGSESNLPEIDAIPIAGMPAGTSNEATPAAHAPQGLSASNDLNGRPSQSNANPNDIDYAVSQGPDLFYSFNETVKPSASTGSYSVLLPDGRTQIVTFTADETGYHPVIQYQNIKAPSG